jgi:hypothetical protein
LAGISFRMPFEHIESVEPLVGDFVHFPLDSSPESGAG